MRPCGLKLSAMNKRWLPILGMLVFSVSLHGQGSVVVFDEQQRFDVVDRYEPDGDTVSLWLSVPLSAYDGPFASLSRYRFSFVRYARRGYAWNCSRRLLNGIDLDNPVTGEPFWNVLPSGWMNSRGSRRPFRRSAMPVTFANTISTFCTSRPAAVQAGCLPTAVSGRVCVRESRPEPWAAAGLSQRPEPGAGGVTGISGASTPTSGRCVFRSGAGSARKIPFPPCS